MATQQQKTKKNRPEPNDRNKTAEQSTRQRGLARREESERPTTLTNSPFAFMRRFSDEMDSLFADFGFGSRWITQGFGRDFPLLRSGETRETFWSPQLETFEREGKLVVRADLPGLTKEDVKVELVDNALTISGERRDEHEEKHEDYYRTERTYGSFYRQIPLPEGVKADSANASFRNGVLEITMDVPKIESRSRRLEISEGEQPAKARAQAAGR